MKGSAGFSAAYSGMVRQRGERGTSARKRGKSTGCGLVVGVGMEAMGVRSGRDGRGGRWRYIVNVSYLTPYSTLCYVW